MAETLGWGILATGGIARLQTADLLTAGLRVAAVGSRSLAKAEAFAAEFNIPAAYGDYEALCQDPNVDIVYVATPHPMHAENALQAVAAGKHVLVEKPFTLNAREARAVVQAASDRGVFVMEAMWTRFLPMINRIMEIIRGGGIGRTRLFMADHNQWLPMERVPRLQDPSLGGGALLDLGIYPLSFASYVFGPPKQIHVSATLTDLGVDELLAMMLQYESGAQAVLHTGSLTPGPNRASIVGDNGRIEIDRYWYNQTTFSHFDRDGARVERYQEPIKGRGMQYQALEAESCVRRGALQSDAMPLTETLQLMDQMDDIRDRIGVVYPSEAT